MYVSNEMSIIKCTTLFQTLNKQFRTFLFVALSIFYHFMLTSHIICTSSFLGAKRPLKSILSVTASTLIAYRSTEDLFMLHESIYLLLMFCLFILSVLCTYIHGKVNNLFLTDLILPLNHRRCPLSLQHAMPLLL